jgi:hypothetical protein
MVTRVTRGAGSPQPVSTTTPTTPPVATGTTASTTPAKQVWGSNAGPKPSDGFSTLTSKVTGAVADSLRNASPSSSYDLVPGRAPGTVSLPDVLKGMGATPDGQAAVGHVIDTLKAKTGVTIPPDVQAAALSNPAALLKALEVTPGQLEDGLVAMNAAYKSGKMKDVAPRQFVLPQQFDLANLDQVNVPRPGADLKQIAPGLFTGDVPSSLPDAQVKRNTVMAETFQRLAANASTPDGQKFEVTLNGQKCTTLPQFTQALQAAGYNVNVSFDSRVANFAALKAQVPGSNPPAYVDVPAPLMLKTGVKDAQGHEAVVPAAHSEMIVDVSGGPASGPALDSSLKYYQGTSGTGFFANGSMADPAWLGRVHHGDPLTGAQAAKAIDTAGAFADVVHQTAQRLNLYADGYGITGVCNDSVAVVQQALTGHADEYPLLMNDSVLYGELKKHLGQSSDPTYQSILKAIKDLPSDTRANPSAKARALASLPWAAGQEPFASSAAAREILSR